MGDLPLIIALIVSMVLIFSGAFWVMDKFFGVKVTSRGNLKRASLQSLQPETSLEKQSDEDVAEGIKRVESKGFAKTHSNVLSEVRTVAKAKGKNPIQIEVKPTVTPYSSFFSAMDGISDVMAQQKGYANFFEQVKAEPGHDKGSLRIYREMGDISWNQYEELIKHKGL